MAKGGLRGGGFPIAGPGRSLIGGSRYAGRVEEWTGVSGWLRPLQSIAHPQVGKFSGRIHLEQHDVRGGVTLTPGDQVDFLLYRGPQGLGAADCRQVAPADGGEAKEDLPPGWERVWSPEHEECYYWNRFSKESSWEHPSSLAGVGAGGAPEEPAGEEDGEPLPPGWERHFDAERGEFYYWNRHTKATQWDRPGAEEDAAAPEEEEEEEAEEEDEPHRSAASAGGKVLAQQRVQGKVVKWHGFFGWASLLNPEELSPDLQALLEQHQDKVYVNWREVQDGTKLEVGSHVDFLPCADDNGVSALQVRLHTGEGRGAEEAPPEAAAGGRKGRGKKGKGKGRGKGPSKADPLEKLERQWAKQDKELGLPKEPAAEGGVAGGKAQGELLPGWDEHWSDEHQCYFYWHRRTGVSTWDRPALPPDAEEGNGTAALGGLEEEAAAIGAPIVPTTLPSSQRFAPTAAPPQPWVRSTLPVRVQPPAWPQVAAKRPRLF